MNRPRLPAARAEPPTAGAGGPVGSQVQHGAAQPAQLPLLDDRRRPAEVELEQPEQRGLGAAPGEQRVRLGDQLPPAALGPAPVQHQPGEAGQPVQLVGRRGPRVEQHGPLGRAPVQLVQHPLGRGQEALQELGVLLGPRPGPGQAVQQPVAGALDPHGAHAGA